MPAGASARKMAESLREEARALAAKADDWHAGAVGEERVERALHAASSEAVRVLHDRLLDPGSSDANLDHLVVATSGVYLVDAKNWTGNVTLYNDSLYQHWNTAAGRQSAHKNQELYKVRGMAAKVGKAIGRDVTPVLCLASDRADQFGPPQEMGLPRLRLTVLGRWI